MSRILKILITSLVVLGISLFIIFVFSEGENREVKNIVITYNDVLRKAHLEFDASRLRKLTSERQLKKIDSYIAFNFKNGRVVNGELKELKFKDVKIKDDTSIVITTERWVWNYAEPSTKKPISEVFDDLYGNTYQLKKIDGHWVVDDLTSNVLEIQKKD